MITELTVGLIGILTANGLGVYDPTTVPAPTDVAIGIQDIPPEPDNVIVLSPRPALDSADVNDSIVAVQVYVRGPADPTVAMARDEAIFNLFQSLNSTVVNGVPLAAMWRQSSTLVGQDANQRNERYSTYYCRVSFQTAHRPD